MYVSRTTCILRRQRDVRDKKTDRNTLTLFLSALQPVRFNQGANMRDTLRDVLDGTASANNPHNRNGSRSAARRAQLVADGRQALTLIKTMPIADVLMLVGGSRARLYRAMEAARAADRDPLLD